MTSWLAGGALLLLAALAVQGTEAPARAQEAARPKEKTAEVLSLTPAEQAVWNAYLRGDAGEVFKQCEALLLAGEPQDLGDEGRNLYLALLSRAANETAKRVPGSTFSAVRRKASSGFTKAYAAGEWLQTARSAPDDNDWRAAAEALGAVQHWWVCGPFPNERGAGFEEQQEPERQLGLDVTYTGKDGHPCQFRKLPVETDAGVIDLGALMRPNKEAVAYLLAAVKVSSDYATGIGWLDSSGPAKQWESSPPFAPLKPETAFEVDLERPFNVSQSRDLVDLRKGWNLLLVKSAPSEKEWKVRFRFNPPRGVEVQWAQTEAQMREALAAPKPEGKGSYAVGLGGGAKPARSKFAQAAFELFNPSLDQNDPTVRKELSAQLAAMDAAASAELRAVLTFLLAEASKSTSRVASGKEENKRRELLEQVLKLDPKAARAALELAKYYSGTFRNPTEADRYAKMAVALAPNWVEARVFAARVATMKGLDGEVERELNALLKEYPNHPSVLRFAGYYRGLRGDYAGSDDLYKRCLEKGDFTDEYCRARLFDRAVERNDVESAVRYAGETRRLNPFDLDSSEGLIRLFLATSSLERAMAECERALNICPREDNFLARKGEIYMRMAAREPAKAADLKVKAIAAYREAIKCNPNREDLVRYLEFMAEEKPEWEVKLQENIEARVEAALKVPVDGDDPYRVVYREEITVVNDDGTKSIYYQYAYRVCNDDGREVLQELGAPAYAEQVGRCVGARVYRRDGSTEEGRRVESQAMLPPLDVGDIVAVRYRVSDTAQSFFGDFFGAMEPLGDYVPVDEVRLVYVLPKARRFFEYTVNGAPKAERREEGDKAIWTYTAKNLARVPREHNQLPLVQMVPTVQISTYENWKDFGRWYYNLIKKQLEPTPEMRAKVASLIEGKTSERDKARAIYNWVVTNIRYNADWHFGVHGYKPFSAGAIFERCIGDCKDKAIVICTMLSIAGIKAYPVLIRLADSSEPRGREDITLPMPHHFNHAIAYIEYADGKGQFVDGTATFNGFDELPGGDAGANVIIVRPDGGVQTQIPLPAPQQNASREEATLEFMGNGKVKLSVTLTATGDRASFLRAIYLQSGTRATQIENQWARHKPGAKVLKVEANDLANIDLAPEVKYEIEIPDAYTTDAQGNVELAAALNPLLFSRGLAAATARRTDIALNEPYQWQSVVRIKLPEGRVHEKPAPFAASAFGVALSVKVETADKEAVITRTYTSGGGVVAAADYGRLREIMLAFDRAEAAKLKLAKSN